jgi:hypothetical protein
MLAPFVCDGDAAQAGTGICRSRLLLLCMDSLSCYYVISQLQLVFLGDCECLPTAESSSAARIRHSSFMSRVLTVAATL